MSDIALADSELVKILREHLARSRVPTRLTGPRTLFLPWFTLNPAESKAKLEQLAGLLDLPLLILPAQYSVTQDARLLRQLAKSLCQLELAGELERTFDQLPYSEPLEEAVIARMSTLVDERKEQGWNGRLALASLSSGGEAESSVNRTLERARQIGVATVLVLAPKRPSGMVEVIDLPVQRLRKDVFKLIAPEHETSKNDVPTTSTQQSPGAKPPLSFYQKLLRFFDSAKGHPESETHSSPQRIVVSGANGQSKGAADSTVEKPDDDVADWADLLTRLSAANWGITHEIAAGFEQVGRRADAHFKGLREEIRLAPDNNEERELLELRLRFIEMLRVLFPAAFEAAAYELDGADQLYRALLILCGQTHSDSLVASNLLPFWQQQLDDPLFRELCYACFNEIGRDRSLVPRIESRTQLYLLLALAGGKPPTQGSPRIDELFKDHRTWIRALAKEQVTFADLEPIRGLVEHAQFVLDHDYPTATDALRAAQALMSAYELLPDERDFDHPKVDRTALYACIESLTRRAISQSRGAIRFDAALLRARALTVQGEIDAALDVLRIMRRTVREKLSRCAVDIEEAFVHERAGDLLRATHLYEQALIVAEHLGADELVARSANGCLRCDAAGFKKNPQYLMQIRARIIVQIQSARAAELFPMSCRDKPKIFISYRRESGAITELTAAQLPSQSKLDTWSDLLLAKEEDFNPTIHQRLHDADAILLLLSPNYFDSAWCVHELHFALGQNDVRGIPLYWAWCTDDPEAKLACELAARNAFNAYVKRIYGPRSGSGFTASDAARLNHQQAHVKERLDRLFARSRLLLDQPIAFAGPDMQDKVNLLIEALGRTEQHLYKRAKLRYPPIEKPIGLEPAAPEPRSNAASSHTPIALARIAEPTGVSPCP